VKTATNLPEGASENYSVICSIPEIFLLKNLSINVPYHRLTMTIDCLNFYSGNLSRFQYFDRKGNTHQG
jgi:hypothetical protein